MAQMKATQWKQDIRPMLEFFGMSVVEIPVPERLQDGPFPPLSVYLITHHAGVRQVMVKQTRSGFAFVTRPWTNKRRST